MVKNENLFFLTDPAGIAPKGGDHGFGLYYHDCRYLSGYELEMAGAKPLCLVSTAADGYLGAFQLTNPDIRMSDGELIRKEEIGIKWERLADAGEPALHEAITVENFEAWDAAFQLALTFDAGFEDVFAIRGLLIEKLGRAYEPEWKDGALRFVYEGAPVGYHLGTVWPHDNSIIAAGFRQHGFDEAAMRIFAGVIRAAMNFEHYRLPELFAGFSESEFGVPARYPVACHPQAWAAGSVPYLLETSLGLIPEAFERRLRVERPQLPDFVHWIEAHDLKVGEASADLRFERAADGTTEFSVTKVDGKLDVIGPEDSDERQRVRAPIAR